jgi:hypothetical protein
LIDAFRAARSVAGIVTEGPVIGPDDRERRAGALPIKLSVSDDS